MRTALDRAMVPMVLVALAFAACERAHPAPSSRAAVQIFADGASGKALAVITEAEYREELARVRLGRGGELQTNPLPLQLARSILDRLVDRRILLLEAQRLHVKVSTAAVAREFRRTEEELSKATLRQQLIDTYQTDDDLARALHERLLVGRLMAQEVHPQVKVTDAEVKTAWEQIPPAEKNVPRLVHARQILVRTAEEGAAILKRLKKGEDFAALAMAHSLGPEASRGGDLGWFDAGSMPHVFDQVCFALSPGQISDLTASEYGFHIFEVLATEPERALTLEATRDRLHSMILHEKLQNAEANYLVRLRGRYRVEKDAETLASVQ